MYVTCIGSKKITKTGIWNLCSRGTVKGPEKKHFPLQINFLRMLELLFLKVIQAEVIPDWSNMIVVKLPGAAYLIT